MSFVLNNEPTTRTAIAHRDVGAGQPGIFFGAADSARRRPLLQRCRRANRRRRSASSIGTRPGSSSATTIRSGTRCRSAIQQHHHRRRRREREVHRHRQQRRGRRLSSLRASSRCASSCWLRKTTGDPSQIAADVRQRHSVVRSRHQRRQRPAVDDVGVRRRRATSFPHDAAVVDRRNHAGPGDDRPLRRDRLLDVAAHIRDRRSRRHRRAAIGCDCAWS